MISCLSYIEPDPPSMKTKSLTTHTATPPPPNHHRTACTGPIVGRISAKFVRVLTHSHIRSLVRPHRLLIYLLALPALCSAHSLARSLVPELVGQGNIFVQFSKGFESHLFGFLLICPLIEFSISGSGYFCVMYCSPEALVQVQVVTE